MHIRELLPADAEQMLGCIASFDAVVTGMHDPESELEERGDPLRLAMSSSGVLRLQVKTGSEGTDGKDRFDFFRRRGVKPVDADVQEHLGSPNWVELPGFFKEKFSDMRLLFDLTTLSGSAVLQFAAAFRKLNKTDVAYCYTAPERYPQVDDPETYPPLITRTIKQPHGYRSFAHEFDSGRRVHIILLGFDRHRPNKFIEHYQWPLSEVRAVIGEPAYVEGGEEQARLSLGKVYQDLAGMQHVHTVDPKNPDDVIRALRELAEGHAVVDIVPLGPKPVLLGTALYWLSLAPDAQERTRILYDFPRLRKKRTTGTGTTWLYT